jgi:A/G-specific adenine glycosylase
MTWFDIGGQGPPYPFRLSAGALGFAPSVATAAHPGRGERTPPSASLPPHGKEIRSALLAFYDAEARDLPWRRSRDPYAIWVSEVMLQQTQVSVVAPYWERFLARFPTVAALACAPLDAVLGAWRGLGYYARARNLKAAAEVMVKRHRGALPASAAELGRLPGFGRYTVGAVASIAFGIPEPVVDGNVARVLSRLFAVEGRPGDPGRERRLWELATGLVAGERPGDWNQALMELGATVCRVAQPLCLLCPVRAHCQALALGKVEQLPPPRPAAVRRQLRLAVAAVHRRGRLLLGRRPARGLFGGLWELPAVEVEAGADARALHAAMVRLLGRGTRIGSPLGEVRRTLTHRELTLCLFRVEVPRLPAPGPYAELRWVRPGEVGALGVSAAMQAALDQLAASGDQRAASKAPKAMARGTPSSRARSSQAAGRPKLSVQPMPKRLGKSSAGSSRLT